MSQESWSRRRMLGGLAALAAAAGVGAELCPRLARSAQPPPAIDVHHHLPFGSPVPGSVAGLAALGLTDAALQQVRSGNARAVQAFRRMRANAASGETTHTEVVRRLHNRVVTHRVGSM
jgi:hypothetical protein